MLSGLQQPIAVFALRILLGALATGFMLAGCERGDLPELDLSRRIPNTELAGPSNGRGPDNEAFIFGFDSRGSVTEDARQYLPFLRILSERSGYRLRLHITPPENRIVEELGAGTVDFAAIGAVGFLQAEAQYGARMLVRGVDEAGRNHYRSKIVVRPRSAIRRIEDLRGKTLAFGNRDSTQGYLIPRIALAQHRIGLEALGGYRFTGSHFNCANAVINGSADACGMQDKLADRLVARGQLRIIFTSEAYPSSGVAAAPEVPDAVQVGLRQALLEFDPRKAGNTLYHWEDTEMAGGFVAADPSDYQKLRTWMIRFGLLPAAAGALAP